MRLDFWFDFASTYSYLAAMAIEEAAAERDLGLRWRTFLIGPIFHAQGWDTSPFNIYQAKGRNMWRDMERQCAARGLPLVRPVPFPQNSLKAARIAIAAEKEPWQPAYCRNVFAAQFGEGRTICDDATLADALTGAGAEPRDWLELVSDPEVKGRLRRRTDDAIAAGIFGAPSFLAGDELFWGNDRLEQAAAWAAGKRHQGIIAAAQGRGNPVSTS